MSNVLLLNAILQDNAWLRQQISGSGGYSWVSCPTLTTNWTSIPRLSGGSTFNVCDTSGYYRCGRCCLWTVPSGATIAQFQIWGAGSGTAPGNCCSGSPPGDTGAYAIAIIPVVAGCQYTLCSGCAFCCCSYCTVGSSGLGGCHSFVTGYNLTNVCALGGANGHTYCTMVDYHGSDDGCCRYNAREQRSAGPCICQSSVWYCFSNSCATCGEIPITASARKFCGTVGGGGFITGLPSFHAGGCLTSDHYGYFCHAPVISDTHGIFTNSDCVVTFTSGSCCGGWNCSANNGYRQHPGGGGAFTHMMGGNTEHYGDQGRMGMIKVTYC